MTLATVLKRMSDTPKKVRAGLQGRFAQDGQSLMAAMQEAAPSRTGKLRESIKAVPSGSGFRITAGGPLTTTTSKNGRPYDHALATEFGTRHEKAHPFFYPTLRAAKAGLRKGAADAVKKALK